MRDTTLQRPRVVPPDVPAPSRRVCDRLGSAANQNVAFERVYLELAPMVWRLLRRLGIEESDIEDVLQDVFTVVSRKLPQFEGRSTLRTWVYAITLRVAKDRRRRGHMPLDAEKLVSTAGDPFTHMTTLQGFELFQSILEQMEDSKRQVLVLHEIEQLKVVEIVEVTGLRRFTVYARLRAARAEFKKRLARHRFLTQASVT